MQLKDTVEMMNSKDYKERFKAEYYQLLLRLDALTGMLIDRGMPIQEVSKYLGHEDLRTTQIYVKVEQERIKQSHKKFMS